MGSYSKGNIFLSQLEYVIGAENVAKGLKSILTILALNTPHQMMQKGQWKKYPESI